MPRPVRPRCPSPSKPPLDDDDVYLVDAVRLQAILSRLWILDDEGVPIRPPNLMAWAAFMDDEKRRRVARFEQGPWIISTVFMAISRGGDNDLFWESALIHTERSHVQFFRYRTRDEAVGGHEQLVAQVSAWIAAKSSQ